MPKIIFFFSQDPGSANAIFPVIKKMQEMKELFKIFVFATRQSKDIFCGEGINFTDLDVRTFFSNEFPSPDLIITGASAGHCPEKEAILFGKKRGVPTISILDFWSNYISRYSQKENDFVYLPDFIFVMDPDARNQMIELGFPEKKIIVTGNPFFDTFKAAPTLIEAQDSILYVSQPEVKEGKYYSDYALLDDLLEVRSESKNPIALVIRPHPKEEQNAYGAYCRGGVTVDRDSSISSLLQRSSLVIGKHSMVLFEAVFSGKLVISYQPERELFDRLITNTLGLSFCARSKEEFKALFQRAMIGKLTVREIGVIPNLNDQQCTLRAVEKIKEILSSFT